LPQIITFLPGRFELYKQKRSNQRLLITPFSFSLKSSFFSQSGLARIRGKHLPEVIVASGRSSTRVSVGNIQQRTVLLVLMEVIGASRLMVAQPPEAALAAIADAVERVEGSRLEASTTNSRIIGTRYQCAAYTCETITDSRVLNAGQVCLEGEPLIVNVVTTTSKRAAEFDGCWMKSGVTIRPDGLVGSTVKTGVGKSTS
jgi:hypothetical protein